MDEVNQETSSPVDVKNLVRGAIAEFLKTQQEQNEPAYKNELGEERKRREHLERRVNELVEENRRSRLAAEEAERTSAIRSELQRMGVSKLDLAFRAVKDDISRTEEGRLVARSEQGEVGMKEYLSQFLQENPELLPGRLTGGSGAGAANKPAGVSSNFDLSKVRPGMSADDLEKFRQEVARVASQSILGA